MRLVYTRERKHIETKWSLALLSRWLLLKVLKVKFFKILKVVDA
jgi:hypothetical protein